MRRMTSAAARGKNAAEAVALAKSIMLPPLWPVAAISLPADVEQPCTSRIWAENEAKSGSNHALSVIADGVAHHMRGDRGNFSINLQQKAVNISYLSLPTPLSAAAAPSRKPMGGKSMRKFVVLGAALVLSVVTVPSIVSQAQAGPAAKHRTPHAHMIQTMHQEKQAPAKPAKDPECNIGFQKGNLNWQEHYHCY